jgi:hypothetical protein
MHEELINNAIMHATGSEPAASAVVSRLMFILDLS